MGSLVLVRHGQASFGHENYDRLSDLGHEQARAVGEWLSATSGPPDVLVAGGLRRHEETVAGLVAGANWSLPVQVDPRWDEFDSTAVLAVLPGVEQVDLGDRAQFQAAYLRATARWTGGQHDGDYAEPWRDFVERVRGALAEAAAQAGPGRRVLVVSSGGPIALALSVALDRTALHLPAWNSLQETMVNTGVSRVLVGSRGLRMSTFNEHSHLQAPTYR